MKHCVISGCSDRHVARGWCSKHYQRWLKYGDASYKTQPKAASVDDAFRLYAKASGDCIVWTGTMRSGYGRVYAGSRWEQAHRVSYERSVGPIPAGLELDHICFNRACIKPEHLRPVTRKQNMEHKQGAYSTSQSGVRGVHPYKDQWKGEVNHNKKAYLVGYFDTVEEAAEATRLKRLELFTHNDEDLREAS